MARSLAELKSLCKQACLTVIQSGNREAKSDFELALRDHIWAKINPGQEMPEQFEPMLARNSKDVTDEEREEMLRDGSEWVAQEKINGCRCVLKIRANGINHLISRRISDETYRKNELHDQLPHYRDMDLGPEWDNTVVDGEILSSVAVVDTGSVVTADILQATAATLNCAPEKSVHIQERFGKMVLHAFDLLRFKGRDVTHLPYYDRKDPLNPKTRYGLLIQVVARVEEVMGADLPLPKEGEKKLAQPIIEGEQLTLNSADAESLL